jgi:hypothetical protein
MASAARTFSRAIARSSVRPAVRGSRLALPVQTFRTSFRRGYASEAESGKSSNALLWGVGLAAVGAGAYIYLNGADGKAKASSGPFVPTKEDYQKVYNEIASRLDSEGYDDGSYGPVRIPDNWAPSNANADTDSGSCSFGVARKWYI